MTIKAELGRFLPMPELTPKAQMPGEELTVVSWNLNGEKDWQSRAEGIAEQVAGADVLMFQECPEELAYELARLGGWEVAACWQPAGEGTGTLVTLARSEWEGRAQIMQLDGIDQGGWVRGAVRVTIKLGEKNWHFFNTHLHWGGFGEGQRLAGARAIEAVCHNAGGEEMNVHILGGDFNATPESATMRYLAGLDVDGAGDSTLWVDAWSRAGSGGCAVVAGCTSCPDLPRAAQTAKEVGIPRSDLLPHRRIDYLLTRGWAYGKPGTALECTILGFEQNLSDHHGLRARLWTGEK